MSNSKASCIVFRVRELGGFIKKKSASEKMSVPILSKDPQGQEKIRYFR